MSFTKKISRKLNTSKKQFKEDKEFSLYYAILRVLYEYLFSLRLKPIASFFKKKHEQWIFKYLKENLSSTINKLASNEEHGTQSSDQPIWVSWWTGEDTAPPLVKQCIKSIYKNSNNHPVHFITENNYQDYIDIPEFIINKAKSGQMKLAHLCDYVRISLLQQYGGLWLDSTIFCSLPLSEDYFSLPFFTCKSEVDENCGYISKLRWVTFVLGGNKNNIIFTYLKSAFEEYWKKNNAAIDYLFFDYLIDIGYNSIPEIKNLIDNVPLNNLHRDDLQAAMNSALPAEEFNNIINPDTTLYKLSWRENYSENTADGRKSVFNYFLNDLEL